MRTRQSEYDFGCADFTYGNDYDAQGKMRYGEGVSKFFHWDKRDYTFVYPPRNFPLPPPEVTSTLEVSCHCVCTVFPQKWASLFLAALRFLVSLLVLHILSESISACWADQIIVVLPGESRDSQGSSGSRQ